MHSFISFEKELSELMSKFVLHDSMHAKWLNTLSYMENCGAKKIAACQHPTLVKEEMLKHAAEEFRHAHYLKRQIAKLPLIQLNSYSSDHIFGGRKTLQYLSYLDLKTCRYLKSFHLSDSEVRKAAYLLVTYAIELRAAELYPIYDLILKKNKSRVMVKSILMEEEEHLREMQIGLISFPDGRMHAETICGIESALCQKWIEAISKELNNYVTISTCAVV